MVFDENVQRESAEMSCAYTIVEATPLAGVELESSGPGDPLAINGFALGSDQRTVTLTTGPMSNADYDISVTAVQDVSGNVMTAPIARSFAGSTAPDLTSPVLVYRSPGPNATNVALGAQIFLTFSEPIANFLDGFRLSSGADSVAFDADTNDSGIHVVVTPTVPLSPATQYTIAMLGIQDDAGNPMAAISWSFTTTLYADTTPPSVVSSSPVNGATNVSVNSSLSLTFSEAVDSDELRLSNYPHVGDGEIVWSNGGKTVTITPWIPLTDNQQYTLAIQPGGIRDHAGNANTDFVQILFSTGGALAAGSMAGTVSGDPQSDDANDPSGARVFVAVGTLGAIQNIQIAGSTLVAADDSYDAGNLTDGTFSSIAVLDSNDDGLFDPVLGDAIGGYGIDFTIPDTNPELVTIAGGSRVTGVDFPLFDQSAITGTVAYGGAYENEVHDLVIGLFNVVGFDSLTPDYTNVTFWPAHNDWVFLGFNHGFPAGSYYVGAYLDADDSGTFNPNADPAGFYGDPPTAITVADGSDANDIAIAIVDPPISAPSTASVTWRGRTPRELPAWFRPLSAAIREYGGAK